jgi:glycerol kinase
MVGGGGGILGIDQGTTGTRACVMDADGIVRGQAYATHRQSHPVAGWVEHDPEEIWRNTQRVMADARALAGGTRIEAIGLANPGETIMIWDRTSGVPLYPALVWQDLRTQVPVELMARDRGLCERVTAATGLRLDPYFAAPKLRWLLDEVPGARSRAESGELCAGTIDTWLIWKLTAGRAFVTDVSTAARTLLFDIRTLAWSPWLCDLFDIPMSILPPVGPSAGALAQGEIPIAASLADQPAAMIGQGCLRAGDVKATYGTGCFVYLHAGDRVPSSTNGLLSTVAWQRDGRTEYALDGGVFAAGSVVAWLRDRLAMIGSLSEMDALLSVGASKVVCVPALAGLGAPHWRRDARAAWIGMDLSSSRADLVRAALEGVVCRVAQVMRAMESDAGVKVSSLRADGGLTGSAPFMQMQADLLGVPVAVSSEPEATVMGACYLAARAIGLWPDDQVIARRATTSQVFEPRLSVDQREARMARFDRAVSLVGAFA